MLDTSPFKLENEDPLAYFRRIYLVKVNFAHEENTKGSDFDEYIQSFIDTRCDDYLVLFKASMKLQDAGRSLAVYFINKINNHNSRIGWSHSQRSDYQCSRSISKFKRNVVVKRSILKYAK